MKKLTRSQRNRLKKRKEIIAAAHERGEDPSIALERAGLGSSTEKEGKQEGRLDDDSDKREKARKRIERLKKKRADKIPRSEGTIPDIDTHHIIASASSPSCTARAYHDVLWHAYATAFGYDETVRGSSGLVHETIHPSSPIPISALERTLMQSEPTSWRSLFATPPVLSDPPTARPVAVYISPSALGALDCLKACQTFHKGCPIAKLFAKHMKVAEQIEYVEKHPMCMALGTPNRLLKLASDAHVSFSDLKYLILDMRKNKKNQTLVDIPDIAGDFWTLWNTFLSPQRTTSSEKKHATMQYHILIIDD